MPRLPLLALSAASAAVASPGCDVGPSDEPLPTVEELRAEFGRQPEGQGVLIEGGGNGDRYETGAVHLTNVLTGSGGTVSTFFLSLRSADPAVRPPVAVTVILYDTNGTDLRAGDEFTASFSYSGLGDGSSGGGTLGITAAAGDRIEGVFAADLSPKGLYPEFRRVRGAFHAVPDTTGG
jgi:hypothetical protein